MLAPQVIIPAVLVPLIGYRLYRRFRTNIGRQPIQPQRLMLRLGLLSLVIVLFIAPIIHSPTLLEAAAGGVIAGALVAMRMLTLGYYLTYSAGVLSKSRALAGTSPVSSPPSDPL